MQKARRHPYKRAPTACKRTVSGSVSLPCSGFFSPFPHGTGPLSVFRSYLALRDGPRGFGQDSSCPALLRWPAARSRFPVPDCHCLRCDFPDTSGSLPPRVCQLLLPRHCRNNTGLGSFPFARHYSGNRSFLSLPAGTKMFQFPALARVFDSCAAFSHTGCPIRMSADQSLFAAPRSFSQLTTSFLAA